MSYRREIIYILVAGGIGFASLNTGNNLQWLMFSLMCGLAILAKVWAYINIRGITAEVKPFDEYFAGNRSYFPVKLNNSGRWFSSYSFLAEIWLNRLSERQKAFIPYVQKGDYTAVLADIIFTERGEYIVESIKLTSLFPFGIFKSSKKIFPAIKFIVYPKILPVDAVAHSQSDLEFKVSLARKGDGNEILRLYPYSGHEHNRNIHWKLSAKKDELWVKEFSNEESEKISVCLDWNYIPNSQRELAISLAASLCVQFNADLISWRLVSGAFETSINTGVVHLKHCLRYLALMNEYKSMQLNSTDSEHSIKISELLNAYLIKNQNSFHQKAV